MSKRPSILFLSQWYWPEPIGTGFAIARTAEILIERFSTVTVFTTRPHYPGAKIYNDYVSGELDHQVQNGVAIERLWTVTAKGGGLIARIKSEFAFFLSVMWRRLFGARINFDIVISVCPSIFAVFAGWLYALGGRRHVCIVHDIQSGLADGLQLAGVGYIARIIRFLERFAFNRCDALVVLNEGMRSELHSIGVTKPVMVIPPLFDIEAVTPRELPADRRTQVLYSGNLGRKQGLEQILEAAALLKERRPDIRLVIRGDGNRRDALQEFATGLGLDNVVFDDLVPPERLADELAASAVHLVPQKPEGARFAMPSKIFMIMAAGRPAVCTADENSPLHALMGETGAIACSPPNDAQALSDQVIRLIEDVPLATEMGQRGRAYVERVLSPANYRASLERVLLGTPT